MKFKKISKKWIALVVIIALVGIGVATHGKKKVVQVDKEVPNVKVKKIAVENITSEVRYVGKLEGAQSVTASSKNSGKVLAANVNVGDKVTAGQVLFKIDSSELEAQLQQQEAALSSANANLVKTNGANSIQPILNAEQQLAKDQIAYNDALDAYNKNQKLFETGAISKQDLINSKSKLDTETLTLKDDEDNLNLQKEQIGPQSVQIAVSQVKESQANVNSVKTQINNSTVTAPMDGVVSAKNVEVGSIASAGASTVTIINTASLVVQITVPDKVVGKLQVGQSVPVLVSAAGNQSVKGVIDTISPEVDAKNNFYIVKIKINNSDGVFKAGMFAKVSISDEKKDNAVVVPNEALKVENGVKYIYTVQANKIKRLVIDTGITNDKITEIKTEVVKPGMEIITEGQSLLNDGEKVNVVK